MEVYSCHPFKSGAAPAPVHPAEVPTGDLVVPPGLVTDTR
ncbi:hypothetical protein HMPREF9575_01048 [Cutibacterium acnes HL110PA1]|nr:hypothetical protein HMPREF9575_01048 [Cutibacterium acnes HL110PA1]EFS66184.1 hypothetical protein HMPREF9612_01332 [Cutibacterium acnes HL063PA2]